MSRIEEIISLIESMTVLEMTELVKYLEERFGVTAQPQIIQVQKPVEEEEKEQTEFDVILKSWGDKKIPIIQAVRSITGLGLRESRDLVVKIPATIVKNVSKYKAEDIQSQLMQLGAAVEIK